MEKSITTRAPIDTALFENLTLGDSSCYVSMSSSATGMGRDSVRGKPLLTFQVLSDIHLEMLPKGYDFTDKLPPTLSPLLVLAGDVYVGREDNLGEVLRNIAARFQHVIYVAGNHEYYGFRNRVYAMSQVLQYIKDVCDTIPNMHFLNDSSVTINGVKFIGGTMWTNIPESEYPYAVYKMGDYSVIGVLSSRGGVRELSPEDVTEMHQTTRRYFAEQIAAAKTDTQRCKKIVAVTHHAPSPMYPGNWFRGDEYKSFYFSTDLDELLENPPVAAWIHGHTHSSNNVDSVGGAKVLANPRGYDALDFKELNPKYDRNQVVSVYATGPVVVTSVKR